MKWPLAKYVSEVRAWHLRTQRTHLCGELDYGQIRDLLRGISRLQLQPEGLRRWGVRTQDLSQAIRTQLDTDSREGSMWAAALATAFCGLLRGAEFALQDGEAWDALRHLTRADVSFRVGVDGREHMVLRMRPAKKHPGQRKSVPLLIAAGGSLLDPVRLMRRMFELDPVAPEMAAATPLYRRASGASIRVREVRGMVQRLMGDLGLDPQRFGAHSLRIGGATAALAAGMTPATIRAAGRWSSDVYQIYCRVSRQSAAGVALVIGSTPFEDLERGVQFVDEELMLSASEMPAVPTESFADREMLLDAWADADDM